MIFKTSFPNTGKIVDPFMQMQVEVKKAAEATGRHLSGGNNLDTNMIKAIDILQEISINIPETIDLEITRFVLNPGRIVLSGTTQNYHEVDKIKGMIEKSKFFKEVRISSATADKTGKSIIFQFNIDL